MSHCSARPACPGGCACSAIVKRELGIAAGLKPDLSRAVVEVVVEEDA